MHLTVNQDYVGSNPTLYAIIASVAQLMVQLPCKKKAVGLNPTWSSLEIKLIW